jgi:hypothetical protein
LYGIKSHDCHVFMQTLIPLAYRNLLPKGIWDAQGVSPKIKKPIKSKKQKTITEKTEL